MAAEAEPESIVLPPGFRFHPTDEELITHYLAPKLADSDFVAAAVGEADLNKSEPWDLPNKAKMGEKEWYFFCLRDKKYPTGMRTNRATESGYWKATGKDKEIFKDKDVLVGMKKTLVFYTGRAPKGEKTNWVMHEFRAEGKPATLTARAGKDGWVVCRVFHKVSGEKKAVALARFGGGGGGEDMLMSSATMPGLTDMNNFDTSGYGGGDDHFKPFLPDFPDHNWCNSTPISTTLYPRIQTPPLMPQQFGAPALPYFNQTLAAANGGGINCKPEQHSNQSVVSVSQETGLSMDRNLEISSRNTGGFRFDDLDDPMQLSPMLDLDSIWKFF